MTTGTRIGVRRTFPVPVPPAPPAIPMGGGYGMGFGGGMGGVPMGGGYGMGFGGGMGAPFIPPPPIPPPAPPPAPVPNFGGVPFNNPPGTLASRLEWTFFNQILEDEPWAVTLVILLLAWSAMPAAQKWIFIYVVLFWHLSQPLGLQSTSSNTLLLHFALMLLYISPRNKIRDSIIGFIVLYEYVYRAFFIYRPGLSSGQYIIGLLVDYDMLAFFLVVLPKSLMVLYGRKIPWLWVFIPPLINSLFQ